MSRNMKPEFCKYPDCFHCPYDDCHYSVLEYEDYQDDESDSVTREKKMARERSNRYAKNNREKIRQYSLKHYHEHREEYNERSRIYQKENRERVNAMKRKRWAENPEKYRQKQREYRARKKEERLIAEREKAV